jgi:hypothetical protein
VSLFVQVAAGSNYYVTELTGNVGAMRIMHFSRWRFLKNPRGPFVFFERNMVVEQVD